MSVAAFVFFYLVAAILAMQKPILIVWGFGVYAFLVVRSIWVSSGR